MTTLAIPQQHPWKANVFSQLKERNRSETSGYVELIKQCNLALRKEKECRDRALALEKEVLSLRSENSALKRGSTVVGNVSVGAVSSTPELENRLSKLQEELTVSYKRNSDNAQLMLELSKKAKTAEEEMIKRDAEIAQLKARLDEEQANYHLLVEKMNEAEKSLQLVKTELMAVQEKASLLSAQNLKLEGENQQLVERWLKKMAEEAEKMNTANQFYNEMVEAHQRVEVMNKVTQSQGPLPMAPGTPIVKKLGFFDDISFMDCSAILPTKAKKKISQHSGEVTCVAFSKSGLIMASGSIDKTVRLWDAPTGAAKTTLQGPTQSVMSVQFSPSDEFVAGASNDNACRLWHLETCRLRHTLTGHVGKVFSCAFADSQKLFTGSHDRTIKMWDLTKGYSTRTIFCYSSLNDLCIAPDGNLLISGHMDHHLRFWDTKSGEVVHVMDALHENNITSVSLSTDGTKVLTNSRDNTMKIVDIRTHEIIITLKDENYRNGLSWTRACLSPDMRYAAAGSMDGTLVVWNTNSGKVEKVISNVHTSPIAACTWNLLGTQFATAGDKDKMIVMWE